MARAGVILMPTPGVGHLISMVEFSKLLLKDLDTPFSITILLIRIDFPSWASAIEEYISHTISLNLDITFEYLPSVEPPCTKRGETFMTLLVNAHKHLVKEAISNHLSTSTLPIVALVLDLFCTSMIDVAKEFGISSYIYFATTAAMLGLMLYLPEYYSDSKYSEEAEFIELPGLPSSLPVSCVPNIMRDKEDEDCRIFLRHGERIKEVEGIIVNTFEELEPGPVKALADGCCVNGKMPEVFAVGPLLAVEKKSKEGLLRHECLKWLDGQPESSVVFLCFGSAGCFEGPQVGAIADGLERSGRRFLWTLRSPSKDKLRLPTDSNLDEVLPEGFLERTKEKGMVWPSWAPQAEILSHPSVGGFVTHCGWNSILESIWHGVPMLAWPLYAEQRLNAFEMGRVLGIALELGFGEEGFVSSMDVERGVRVLMGEEEDGVGVRRKVERMKAASRRSLEKGGSGWFALESFAYKLVEDIRGK